MNFAQQHALLAAVRSYGQARAMAAKQRQTGIPESAKPYDDTARRIYANIKSQLLGDTAPPTQGQNE